MGLEVKTSTKHISQNNRKKEIKEERFCTEVKTAEEMEILEKYKSVTQ